MALRHLRQLVNAELYSASADMPWTTHCTIHFRLSPGFREEDWPAFQTRLFDKAARWLHRNNIRVSHGWVREYGPIKGPHVHLALHLPHSMWGQFKAFLLRAGGFTEADQGSEAIRITGGAFGMYVPTMRAGLLRYLSKSLDCSPRTIDALGLTPHPSLPVFAQRCGVSHSCGIAARRQAGWQERRSLQELSAGLNPARPVGMEVCHVEA